MVIIEEFKKAFQLVDRFEEYKLIRAWGMIIVITGIARFFLGFIIFNLFFLIFKSSNSDLNTALVISVFNYIVRLILISSLAVIMIYTYLSIRQTTIKDGKIISSKVFNSGIALTILFILTFVIEIPYSVYWEEVVGIFITYFILKRSIRSDFKELRYLGAALFVISVIEFIGRVYLVVNFMYKPLFTPLWIIFYLVIGFAFMLPYIISGFRIFKKASLILEE